MKEQGESEAQVGHYDRNMEELIFEKARELNSAIANLKRSHLITLHKLAELAEKRDTYKGEHLNRMMNYSMILAKELGLTRHKGVIDLRFINNIYYMSPLHDIGKVAVPDAILLKRSGLTKEEFEKVKTHTLVGAEILAGVEFMEMGRNIALYHHERWDGKGYPHGLRGEEIPPEARIVALVDVFDVLTSNRCYKEPLPMDATIAIIEGQKDRAFEPEMVDTFLRRMDRFIAIKEEYSDS
jgi:putative two-component system response regulator